jgi:hypothetical protein
MGRRRRKRRYWRTWRKGRTLETEKRKHEIAISGEVVLEEAMDVSYDRLRIDDQ